MTINLSIVAPNTQTAPLGTRVDSKLAWQPAIIDGALLDQQQRARRIADLDVEYRTVDLRAPELNQPFVAKHDPQSRLDASAERWLFLTLNAQKQRLDQERRSLCTEHPDPVLLEQLEGYQQLATVVRRHLAEVFFKLAVSISRTFSDSGLEMDDLVSQACVTLIRSIELFDPNRGFRFSSYATRAIRTELSRFVVRHRKRAHLSMEASEVNGVCDMRTSVAEQRLHGKAVAMLDLMLQQLEQREAHVVRSRFGLNDEPGGCSLQSLADEYGVTRERVRQLERRALKKLREMAMDSERRTTLETIVEGNS